MFEFLEIVSRVLLGMLPILWVVLFCIYANEKKFIEILSVLTILLIIFGMIYCIFSAIDWL